MTKIFESGFELGNFNAWNETWRSSAEVTFGVTTSQAYAGLYSAMFNAPLLPTSLGAHCTHVLQQNLTEVYFRAYYLVGAIIPATAIGAYIQLMQIDQYTTREDIALVRIQKDDAGINRWRLIARNGTEFVSVWGSEVPSGTQWVCVELHWRGNPTNGIVELYINGVLDAVLTGYDTSAFILEKARFGLCWKSAHEFAVSVYLDECVIADEYVGPSTPPAEYPLTVASNPVQNMPYIIKKGGEIMAEFLTPHTEDLEEGMYEIIAPSSHTIDGVIYDFDHWEDNSINPTRIINLTEAMIITFTMKERPPGKYTLTIQTEGEGTTVPPPSVYEIDVGDAVEVTAIPAEGSEFAHFTLDGEYNDHNPKTVFMDSDHILLATFKFTLKPLPLWQAGVVIAIVAGGTGAVISKLTERRE